MQVFGAEGVVGILFFACCVKERDGCKCHVFKKIDGAGIGGGVPTGGEFVVLEGLAPVVFAFALGESLGEVVHFFGDHQAAVGKILVVRGV